MEDQFYKRKEQAGGISDVIRCDDESYLVWKWHPYGSSKGSNYRENSIRFGSSLRVKEGEVAVFVYKQNNEVIQDYIEGPFDKILKTKNLPVISNVIGLMYDGGTPFQAEVYFINLAKLIQCSFVVPYFDVYDPRFLDFGVPVAVRGKFNFKIDDYKEFIKIHKLVDFDLAKLKSKTEESISRIVKNIVTNILSEQNMPVFQLERSINKINSLVYTDANNYFCNIFGLQVDSIDISAIELDKTSDGYFELKNITMAVTTDTIKAQTEANIKNIHDMQNINVTNIEETMRIQREESQYAQRKQTEMSNFAAFQLEKQAEVGIAGANALGQMGSNGGSEVDGGSMNPAGMMAGVALGGVIGQNMASMMGNMFNGMNSTENAVIKPPTINNKEYYLVLNNVQSGPYTFNNIKDMLSTSIIGNEVLCWVTGTQNWKPLKDFNEFFEGSNQTAPPPIPNSNEN